MIARIATRSLGAWTSPLRGSRTILTRVVVCISILQFATMTLSKRVKSRRASVTYRFAEKTHFVPSHLVAPSVEKDKDFDDAAAKRRWPQGIAITICRCDPLREVVVGGRFSIWKRCSPRTRRSV